MQLEMQYLLLSLLTQWGKKYLWTSKPLSQLESLEPKIREKC